MSVVKINAITVPKERADELVGRFAARAGEDEVDESDLPSGDELASEIERFLRDQS